MKKVICLFLLIFTITACSPQEQPQIDRNALYTSAAKTVAVQLTQQFLQTPSATATLTPVPTITPTPTLQPSPTPIPPTPTWVAVPAGKVTVPMLMYLRIAGNAKDDANYQHESNSIVPPGNFAQQMQLLQQNGYTTVTVSTIADVIRKGGNMPAKPVAITFDNCAIGVYTLAFPVMKSLGMVGTVYVVANMINGSWMCTDKEIKELAAAGWEIGSKGMTGKAITPATYSEEIAGSKEKIKTKTGIDPMSFSYPYAQSNANIIQRVYDWGYSSAVSIYPSSSEQSTGNIFLLARAEVFKNTTLDKFATLLPWQLEFMPTTAPTSAPTVAGTPAAPAATKAQSGAPTLPPQPAPGSATDTPQP
jgi:peptidoglycan/xylan/chitin deacetylase (PgdA/CDA1 family)